MSETFPNGHKANELEHIPMPELLLDPGLKTLIENEQLQVFKDCQELAPLFKHEPTREIPAVRIPVTSEIVKDAPDCGLTTLLEIKPFSSSGGEIQLTYYRRQESFDIESDKDVITIEPSVRLSFSPDYLSVQVDVFDEELKLNPPEGQLDNSLALEVYSDICNAHRLVKPEEDPELEALVQQAA